MIGRTIGNYQITGELAQGNKGVVYRGHHISLSREVVVKEIPLAPFPVSTRVQLKARFRRETFIQAQLNHQGIVRVYESFAKGDNYYVITEYVPGMSLRDLLRRQGLPTTPQALYLCKQALAALDYAHSLKYLDESDTQRCGVIHRDLKPSNILVDGSGKLKVTDFGIVRMPELQSLTPPSFSPGTVEYMPPEQLRGLDLDVRSDIYSLGVTFYEMMTGQLPYMRVSAGMDAEARKTSYDSPPLAIHEVRSDVSASLASIFMRSIFRNPSERFQSASEFLKALKEYERSIGASESPSQPLTAKNPQLLRGDVTIIELGNAASPPPARAVTQPPVEAERETSVAARTRTTEPLSGNSRPEQPRTNSKAIVQNPVVEYSSVKNGKAQAFSGGYQLESSKSSGARRSLIAAAALLIAILGGAYYFNRGSEGSGAGSVVDSSDQPGSASPVTTVNAATPPEQIAPPIGAGDLDKLQQAREADRQGKFNQAAALYDDYLRSGANDAETAEVSAQLDNLKKFIAHLNSAKYAYSQGDYRSASRNYSEALKLRPYSRLVQNGLASAKARLSGKAEAPEGATRPRRVEAGSPPPTPDSQQ